MNRTTKNDAETPESRGRGRVFPVLIGLLVLFFLPLLAGWEKFFVDDIIFYFYPQQAFLSRSLAGGSIPWWNPHLTAGASPFYAHLFQSALSPYNWIFLILGGLFPARDFFWLIKLPVALSFLLSAGFSWLFARRGLRLGSAGSFLFSLAYTLSPAMTYFALCPPETYIQAWLPLFCFLILKYSENGRPGWLAAGILAFALVSPAGDLPVLFHVLLISALFGGGLLVLAFRRRDWRSGIRVVLAGVVIFGGGALLSGVYWANMIEGLRMLWSETLEVVEDLSGRPQSVPPLYLITLFVPDFFGGVTSHHTWGAAHRMLFSLNDANLLGGLALSFAVFCGFLTSPERSRRLRGYWWIFLSIFVFGILVVLGRYTPAYGLFRKAIPVLRMPYPARFRSIQCFALAGLLGVSLELLVRHPLRKPVRTAVIYLSFVVLLAALALVSPYLDGGELYAPGFRQLNVFGDWSWFVTGPLLYLVLGAALLLAVSGLKGGKYLPPLLSLLVAAELLFFSYRAFYHNRILNHRFRDMTAERYRGPDEAAVFRTVLDWQPEKAGEGGLYRRLHYRSRFDNLAWLDGSLSMLGFDIKPLDPRFQEIVEELTYGFPYELLVREWGSRFWPNMGTRYFLSNLPLAVPGLEFYGSVNGDYSYRAEDSLPRFFFLDRAVVCSAAEARAELLGGDLRRGVFVEESNQLSVISNQSAGGPGKTDYRLPIIDYRSFDPGEGEEYLARFEELQEVNRITGLDLSSPNRLVLDLVVTRPALLVVTDIWHPDWRADLNGRPTGIARVNYLQRGIWCPEGEYRVIMNFRPRSLVRGLAASVFGAALLLGLIFSAVRTGRGETREKI